MFILEFAHCIAKAGRCSVGKISCGKTGRMATPLERSEVTWIKQETAHSGTFIQPQLLSRLRRIF